jgi:hypothetical protein
MTSHKPDLIMTLAYRYKWEDLSVFVNSLKNTGFSGDIVVFAARLDARTIREMESRGVIVRRVFLPLYHLHNVLLVPGWRPWRFLLKLIPCRALKRSIAKHVFSIMCARFAHFHAYLARHPDKYDRVMITDARDVCFQGDPFENLDGESIVTFLENQPISENKANLVWLVQTYGQKFPPDLLHKPIACAGVTLGNADGMFDYLSKILNGMYHAVQMRTVEGTDQAIHNYLFHLGLLPGSSVMANGNPICMTMGPGDPFELDEEFRLVSNGKVVSILHQYDRFPALKAAKERCFAKC